MALLETALAPAELLHLHAIDERADACGPLGAPD
jgi:hypothetical protein